jgi:sulfite reductase beta subunit-like hemoprotein
MDHNERNAASRSRLRILVASASEEELRRSVDSEWTVAATLAHLAFWDRFVHARWRAVLDGADIETAVAPPGGIDWTNAAGLPQWRAIFPRAAADDAIHAAAELDDLTSRLPAWAVERVTDLDRLGWLDRTRHRGQHLDLIAAAIDRGSV